ncbi:hypothetical protein DPMN_143005 [Dreissena polymorpha]|uniref:G-protein coupled receptors family 1 profile domain-containing protein n=2 Tax=Dreissena polymorpha TaxID=45954 RepID=A0A9D4JMR2_DREPO|nr:hypothetical protein DPMN_143005 [Dreissena polymorpha]
MEMEHLEEYTQYVFANYMWTYGSPILIVIGTIGNVLSIVVLLRPRLRKSTTMFYLTCLSFGDLFTLYTGLLRYWIHSAFKIDVRNLSNGACKVHTFLVYLWLDFTVWVLVSVTVDRCISVSLPFRVKRLCTIQRSRIVVTIIWGIMFIKNMHFFWTLSLVETWKYSCGGSSPAEIHFLHFVWPWLDMATFCIIPFTIMIVCNIKIIYKMVKAQRKLHAHNKSFQNENATEHMNDFQRQISYSPNCLSAQHPSPQNTSTSRRERPICRNVTTSSTPGTSKISSLTAMLLAVNTVFLITTLPVQVLLIGEEYWFPNRDISAEQIAWYSFWWALVNMLQYLNNSIHFVLYCLTGPRFRHELRGIFRRKTRVGVMKEQTQTEF